MNITNDTHSEDARALADSIGDCLSPETVSVITTALFHVAKEMHTDDPGVNAQYAWFAETLAAMVGGVAKARETARQYGIE